MVRVRDNQIEVTTRTLRATWADGVLTSLSARPDGQTLVDPAPDDGPPMYLIYASGEAVAIGREMGDRVYVLPRSDTEAEIRIEGWHGDGAIRVSEDVETGDMVVEPSGYASRPGLRACRLPIGGIAESLKLVAPFFQGVRLPLDDPLIRNSHWQWPHQWEAGLAILEGAGGGWWVRAEDDRYRYKALHVGSRDTHDTLGLDTETYGPMDANLSAGNLEWRINTFAGDWETPAATYRAWMAKAYDLAREPLPDWFDDIRFAVSWCPTKPDILDAIAARVPAGRVLLHMPDWRTDAYDENYPTYKASETGRGFIETAQNAGFHVMPHLNAIDMDPSHPVYTRVRDFQQRAVDSKRVLGWTWVDGAGKPVPESNAGRLLHRSEKTMVKIHPGLGTWRSILSQAVRESAESLDLSAAFLDVTLCSWNLHNCLVDDMTSTEGMRRLIGDVARLGLVVGGEGRNEITSLHQRFAQVHLFRSWHATDEGLDRLEKEGLCPLNEFLFGNWCKSFGYSGLNGDSPVSATRMRVHEKLGAIPTVTVGAAKDIARPNRVVRQMLDAAGA
ncbi:hypothetical protein HN371_10045 [Candidatus Poribacteria bacterium]|jgi:hypothetical protein|nr:hypothetical protein [Candidatus Poribacteria bacterium]MBT5711513.1 hypothetical protein [Candidatus Poribacteria bacterium]MBT7098521.1 hypothetical protein [Candidatus Poribacteria bacterium]MBT7807894.1 hypothetical protein [Candidatus Poribacteria bacterium]